MSFPAILARMLDQQAELAAMVANRGHIDVGRRQRLAQECVDNAAAFRQFVNEYRISVKRRPCAPPRKRAAEKPHCDKCAKAR